jgi:2-polyprenyl-3-methyl-5-hydroxy-6-metoxy-1,4-benzoquinol methylase
MLEPLKGFFRGSRGGQAGGGPPLPAGGARKPLNGRGGAGEPTLSSRPSRGLAEFFTQIRDTSGLTILDLGGATQKNVSFITDLGHRLYSEDFLRMLNEAFGVDDTGDQTNPGRIEYFLKQTLDYPEGHFDGVLVWDVLEYLNPVLLNAVVERLHRIVRPKAYMLAFFHSDDKLDEVPSYAFRIAHLNTLEILQQGMRRPAQLYNNRSLEKLFARFESVKFFLTRERLREVIIKV